MPAIVLFSVLESMDVSHRVVRLFADFRNLNV
jgi:hypothetical protein